MSFLCYDFQKWTIISMAAVALTLTIGLVSLAHGQESIYSKSDEKTRHFLAQCVFERLPEFQHNNFTDMDIKANQTAYACLSDLYGGKLK